MPEIAIVAGEASGDASGAALVKEVLSLRPDIRFWGIGGDRMREAGVRMVADLSSGGAIGLIQSFRLAPGLVKGYLSVRHEVLHNQPDLLILIDFGAFNVRLGSRARKSGIKTFYYFPPSSWRKTLNSTAAVKACADKVVTPFPWSETLLKAGGVDAVFVGHPLLDRVKASLEASEFRRALGLRADSRLVGLLPGSRGHEIDHNLPFMLNAVEVIASRISGVEFVIGAGSNGSATRIRKVVHRAKPSKAIAIAESLTYDVIAHSELLLTCSGTATLEAAILGTPMVIMYRGCNLMRAEYLLRRKRALESFIGMPNIVAEKKVCPEFVAFDATAKGVTEAALRLLENPDEHERMKRELTEVKAALGEPGGTARAARLVLDSIRL